MASSRQRKPSARAEPSADEKGPWWDKYFKFVFTNRAVRDEVRKRDGIVIGRPIHRGCLDEEPDKNERFEILWKAGADYDAINADIVDWQQLKPILTDRFVQTKAAAPMIEHLVLPLQERNWHATDQEYQQMKAATVAAAQRWQERVKEQGKILDQLSREGAADGQQQQAKQQKKGTADKKAAAAPAAAAASGGKAAKCKGKAAAAGAAGTSAAAAAGSSTAAAAGSSKAAAAKPAKAAPAAAAGAAAAGKATPSAAVKGKGKAGSIAAAAAAAGGAKKRPAAAVALANKKQKDAAAAAAERDDDDDEAAAAAAESSEESGSDSEEDSQQQSGDESESEETSDDFEYRRAKPLCVQQQRGQQHQRKGRQAAAAAAAQPSASKKAKQQQQQQPQKKQAAVKQEQIKRHKSDAGAAAAAGGGDVTYKGHTGRLYPAAVACAPWDRRIGTRAYKEGEESGEYPVAAIVDEVFFMLPGAKKKRHLVLPKWEGYELDVDGWEDAAGMSRLACYEAWQQQDKPTYYTAVKPAAAENAFVAWKSTA